MCTGEYLRNNPVFCEQYRRCVVDEWWATVKKLWSDAYLFWGSAFHPLLNKVLVHVVCRQCILGQFLQNVFCRPPTGHEHPVSTSRLYRCLFKVWCSSFLIGSRSMTLKLPTVFSMWPWGEPQRPTDRSSSPTMTLASTVSYFRAQIWNFLPSKPAGPSWYPIAYLQSHYLLLAVKPEVEYIVILTYC